MSKLSLYERQLLEKNIYMDYGYRALTSYAGADTLDMRILSDSAYKECSLFQNSKNPNDELMSTFCRLSGTAFAISQMETNAKVPILDPRFFKVLVEQPLLNIRIYAVNNPVAHAYFMSNWEWRNDRLQIIKEIVNSSKSKFDPAKTALVHRTLSTPESEIVHPEKTELAKQASTKEIEIESIKNDKLRYRIDAEHDGLVVLCDAFYPGWKAFVDGKDHRIFRVNAICRGVFVKSGKHSLEFRYEPDSLKFGFLAALAGLIICIANWLICIRKSAETQEESKIID